jgi:Asp-tRNA(Asn)/Glu-tRNA(Gln) amidotransferase A subunit family amidase
MQQSAQRGRAATKNENYLTTKNAKSTKKFSPPAMGENERGAKFAQATKILNDSSTSHSPLVEPSLRLYAGELPVGLQILTRPFEEATAFRIAYAYEQATEWHERRPGL